MYANTRTFNSREVMINFISKDRSDSKSETVDNKIKLTFSLTVCPNLKKLHVDGLKIVKQS